MLDPIKRKEAMEDLKMLYGLPPYDDGSNSLRDDGYFVVSIKKKYGMDIDELKLELGISLP